MQPEVKQKLEIYHTLLKKWQKTINLIAPSTLEDAWARHFDDSLQLLDFIPESAKSLVDIGSGAGFPGLVIAITRPDLSVHLVESDTRKCAFLRNVSRETLCENITIHNARIEDVLSDINADCLSARALAPLKDLINTARPLWDENIDFKMICPKGRQYLDEIAEAEDHFTCDIGVYPSRISDESKILTVSNIIEKPA